MIDTLLVHGTVVAIEGEAMLLRGPPGAGKSDLALRLIDGGARLVADDQALLRRADNHVLARAPAAIAGLIEVRGVGILRVDPADEAPLSLLVDLVPSAKVERLPEGRFEVVLGLAIPLIALAPFEASATAKLRLAWRAFAVPSRPAILGS
ncbi:MAG TPA: HPr kinase/phosphatase C-terminal domain-containing protein [Stellaceae bacterium]|nr:HPr kinase/phosphatase C-terminal domain-containing protein [Stellaceae bacterium]HMD66515.1 HPr kinase/phosphatase C-terminal domain-containing protein [Stellaceae bacterium]